MKKKMMGLVVLSSLLLPTSAINAEELFSEGGASNFSNQQLSLQAQENEVFAQQQEEDKETRLDLYNQIKNDPDFEIIADNGHGTFAYTNSPEVNTDQEKNRFLQKVEQIEAQKSVTNLAKVNKLNGYMENKIEDNVNLKSPWFGEDQISFSGNNTIQWFKSKSKYENWSQLSGITDVFTVGYSYVSSTTSGVSVGLSSGTIPSANGNASYNWTVTNTSAQQSFTWPSKGSYFYYGKTYGDFQVSTDKITKYSHNSSAIATVGGENILVNSTASTTF